MEINNNLKNKLLTYLLFGFLGALFGAYISFSLENLVLTLKVSNGESTIEEVLPVVVTDPITTAKDLTTAAILPHTTELGPIKKRLVWLKTLWN